jgi:hypothetical protein
MKKIKINSSAAINLALIFLSGASMLLGNKKEAKEREAMKKEIVSEVLDEINK